MMAKLVLDVASHRTMTRVIKVAKVLGLMDASVELKQRDMFVKVNVRDTPTHTRHPSAALSRVPHNTLFHTVESCISFNGTEPAPLVPWFYVHPHPQVQAARHYRRSGEARESDPACSWCTPFTDSLRIPHRSSRMSPCGTTPLRPYEGLRWACPMFRAAVFVQASWVGLTLLLLMERCVCVCVCVC
jgi:hypothetical protein